ncbi:MAG: response regulator [Deltaproteobacteria bacterium]|nr:response regulator [Deltaproteobacteria bacterium]MBK8718980.1 response regulator [Deltaproteobacteria bacterium]MBP7285413.1 response regulator [Nannocystaceae bacterium]
MTEALRVLLVDDSPSDAKLALHELRRGGRQITAQIVDTADAFAAALAAGPWDVVVCDWAMPRFSGPAALAMLRETGRDIPFILMSGTVGEETAVEAMRAGARDFVLKGHMTRLGPAVEREVAEASTRAARREAEAALARSEAQLRQSQKLEAVGRLAGGVAHDFNNLLSVVISCSELSMAELPREHPVLEYVQEIRRAADRAESLTRQLLAFSRGQLLEPRPTALGEVVQGLHRMLRRMIGEDIDLVVAQDGELPLVLLDRGQLEQVLMNLAINARDAMPTGGQLTIEVRNVVLDAAFCAAHPGLSPGAHVLLAVSDDGVGMEPEVQARAFEPFFTTKEIGRGTGLGLSTVLGIVQQSGGVIELESTRAVGTRFAIYFAALPPDACVPAPRTAGVRATPRGRETVLVVEDDASVRELVGLLLRRLGYEVLSAEHGHAACERFDTDGERIDLLLTDVVMPRMGGRELAELLRARRPELRVLYMSGHADDAVLRHGVMRDDVAFLPKPFTPAALADKVREVLDTERAPTSDAPPR